MPVDVVTLKSMVDSHQIANVGIVFLGGYRGFPALPGWEDGFSLLDCTQEFPTICFTVLQKLFSTWRESDFAARGQGRFG